MPDPGTFKLPNWSIANVLNDFKYPWLHETTPEMIFRALWDEYRFYFRFDVTASNVMILSNTNHKMEVIGSDRVEIFFKSDNRLNPYYCLEMDPLGRILDYRARYYRQFEYEWQWPGANQLRVNASLTDNGYFVEGAITIESLRNLSILQKNELQAGLFRGQCINLIDNKGLFNWISWVRPDSEKPDFHVPSAFGMIYLDEL